MVRRREFNEAFFENEFGVRKPNGSHANRFDDSASGSLLHAVDLRNPLDPAFNKVPQPEVIPPGHERDTNVYWIFVPRQVAQDVAAAKRERRPRPRINVTILWGVGGEIDAHGLRAVFEHASSTVIINVSGREDTTETLADGARAKVPAWGVGCGVARSLAVTDSQLGVEPDQVRSIFDAAGLDYAQPSIRVLAAYSTGYRGMVQSINNDLLPLDDVARVIFFDCLYRGDDPALPGGAAPPRILPEELNSGPDEFGKVNRASVFNTRRALSKVLARQSRADIIAYSVTPAGSPLYRHPSTADPVQHFTFTPLLIELRDLPLFLKTVRPARREAALQLNRALTALLFTRYLRTGVNDQFFTEGSVPQGFLELFPKIPRRGEVSSTESTARTRGVISLRSWQRENKDRIDAALKNRKEAAVLINDHRLILPSSGLGEELHRGFVSEFGWEFLL